MSLPSPGDGGRNRERGEVEEYEGLAHLNDPLL